MNLKQVYDELAESDEPDFRKQSKFFSARAGAVRLFHRGGPYVRRRAEGEIKGKAARKAARRERAKKLKGQAER
jgi:hypothetical protein